MRSPFITLLALSLSLRAPLIPSENWDVEYWQYLNWTQAEKRNIQLSAILEGRLNQDLSQFYYFRISENLAYQPFSWLDLEARISFIDHIPIGTHVFKTAERLALEINPQYVFNETWKIAWKNRFEFLKNEAKPQIHHIYRHQTAAFFSLKEQKFLTLFSIYDEIFFDMDRGMFTQNRFAPCDFNWKLGDKFNLDTNFMMRHFYSFHTMSWHKSFVFSTTLSF